MFKRQAYENIAKLEKENEKLQSEVLNLKLKLKCENKNDSNCFTYNGKHYVMGNLVINKYKGIVIKDREGNILLQKKLPEFFNFDRGDDLKFKIKIKM